MTDSMSLRTDTETAARADATTAARAPAPARQLGPAVAPTGWMGWIAFAAVLMMIVGAMHVTYGIIAVANDAWPVWGNQAALLLDFNAIGWTHIVAGGLLVLAGAGLLTGNAIARAVAVVLAAASLLANFAFLAAFPVWSIVMITIDVAVIYAITVHGHEMKRFSATEIDLRERMG